MRTISRKLLKQIKQKTHQNGNPKRVKGPSVRIRLNIGVRGSPERDISSLRALGPGGRQVLRVVRAACALFDVFEEK